MKIIPSGAALCAEIGGFDLSKPLDVETIDAIKAAWDEYFVLVFRGQNLSDPRLVAFSRCF